MEAKRKKTAQGATPHHLGLLMRSSLYRKTFSCPQETALIEPHCLPQTASELLHPGPGWDRRAGRAGREPPNLHRRREARPRDSETQPILLEGLGTGTHSFRTEGDGTSIHHDLPHPTAKGRCEDAIHRVPRQLSSAPEVKRVGV